MKQLVVHIGTGKTGSTAIQSYFRTNKLSCERARTLYWGLNLENAPISGAFEWRIPNGIGILQRMPEPEAKQQVTDALMEAMGAIDGDCQVVWSNESIYEKPAVFMPAIESCCREQSFEIKIVAYVRNVYSYMQSAYAQWGVKHKTYNGRIKGFTEWSRERIDFLSYGNSLGRWHKTFGDNFQLVNYDALVDVVDDFLARIGLVRDQTDEGQTTRDNKSPSDIQLLLYALYNNTFKGPILPGDIARLTRQTECENDDYVFGDLNRIFPRESELKEIADLLQDQEAILNQILAQQHQPILKAAGVEPRSKNLDHESLVQGILTLLTRVIVNQNRRILALEERIVRSRS